MDQGVQDVLGPLRAVLAPVALPVERLQRSSELKDFLASELLDLGDSKRLTKREDVLWRLLLVVLSLSVSAETQEIAFVVKVLDQLPELAVLDEVLHVLVFQVVARHRAARQVDEGLVHEAAFQHVVGPVDFGVGLLQNHDPDLVVDARRE